MIPDFTALGDVEIFFNAFSDWPSNGGIPLTNEFSIIATLGNGSQPPPSNPPTPSQISVTTDSSTYDHESIIQVQGTVTNIRSGTPVTLIVISPSNDIVTIDQLSVGTDGTFSTTLSTAGNLWKFDGTYTIRVQYGSEAVNNKVLVELTGGILPEPTISEPTVRCGPDQVIVNGQCVDAFDNTSTTSFTLETDQSSYTTGDTIRISGIIPTLNENYNISVTILVIDPFGDIMAIAQVLPDSNGVFSHSITAGGLMRNSGDYEIRAQYGTQKSTITFSFTAVQT